MLILRRFHITLPKIMFLSPIILYHMTLYFIPYVPLFGMESLSPLKFMCWNPNPNAIALGGWAFWRWFGHEDWALRDGISAHRRRRDSGSWFISCDALGARTGPHQTLNMPAPWTWSPQPPKLWDINVKMYDSGHFYFLLWYLNLKHSLNW